MGDGHYWGMHWFWWILFVILTLMFFYWLANAVGRKRPGQKEERESALDILKRRYAAGEIDTEEFNTRKRELERGR
ncbi:SHOCT domain-containing protein [Pontibacter sp. E15-1]|uniref:SHOCT domain-containing protein n=1 Tax=Pontibacter sp. E15-1 TaxID=2919918 RepID=UPI001F5036B9|nr:SHOCT domain-containing protein [Pontibacter sp. E15-1]MCJ8163379.1 SHOCT domain-containing protein [Pontibacter sp. E15-1]